MKTYYIFIFSVLLSLASSALASEDHPEMDYEHATTDHTMETENKEEDEKRTPSSVEKDYNIESPDYPSFMGY